MGYYQRPGDDRRAVEQGGSLLFPGLRRDGQEAMLTDWRKPLDRVAQRAGWAAGEIQTTDGGAPVSVFTVAREVGHHSTAMIERTYGHLGTRRHRADVVEYRVEQHASILGSRLAGLGCRDGPRTDTITDTV